jgi:hypothetical protein
MFTVQCRWTSLVACLVAVVLSQGAPAAVTRIEIAQRSPLADGQSFGSAGPYEQLLGRVYFEVDPQIDANRQVVDLDLAPRSAAGRVEFSADLEILAPADLARASGTLLYDVNNRGNRLALGMFNGGNDGFLMRRGTIVVWSGWIAEVLPGGQRLRLDAPVATQDGEPFVGLVRAELAPDARSDRLTITYGASNGSYRPTDRGLATATLTVRRRQADPRVAIPRSQWRLEVTPTETDPGAPEGETLPLVELVLEGGLEPGSLYELIYEAQGPIVQGLGLAGIRDLVSALRYETDERNPLRLPDGTPAVRRTIGFGVSQSGRCLRTLLYDGFNADEAGRQVFDGLMPHVAGAGLGFFNHRFASPTRHNTQHDNHVFPADVFPFAYADEQDPYTGRTDGLLRKARAAGVVPKVMHTQTSAEYWTRAGSLVHTDPAGTRDAELPPEVRLYAFGGAQHGAGSGVAGAASSGQLPHNPTDYRPLLRALLVALERWIDEGAEPPPSIYPKLSDGTLSGWEAETSGWSTIPGVNYPAVINQPEWRDYGADFLTSRRITLHPPVIRGTYRVLAPAYGVDDNERGMLTVPAVGVPVATFTGWNLRSPAIGAETELLSLAGSYIALAGTQAARETARDPRPSLAERYGSYGEYLRQYTAEAERLAAEGYLLEEDLPGLVELARRHEPLFAAP